PHAFHVPAEGLPAGCRQADYTPLGSGGILSHPLGHPDPPVLHPIPWPFHLGTAALGRDVARRGGSLSRLAPEGPRHPPTFTPAASDLGSARRVLRDEQCRRNTCSHSSEGLVLNVKVWSRARLLTVRWRRLSSVVAVVLAGVVALALTGSGPGSALT